METTELYLKTAAASAAEDMCYAETKEKAYEIATKTLCDALDWVEKGKLTQEHFIKLTNWLLNEKLKETLAEITEKSK